ncbi:hypothetical protein Pyn_26850 [Prunus yedoensis var. nudiflora]|uniref:Pectinesterase n=1 Tax=Prunus yedoensis var. nudiflora TaxID=2094558 RepID=A0A314Y6G2_PRUYE|nr:hypothetical protein Pyn_26850 [Prunus yedoensis var. nudiflora]
MSPLMKSSSHFIFFIICFSSLSIDPRADNVDPHLINVPLPAFKNSLEKTKELMQNVASTMSHMHAGEDLLDGNSTVLVISYCEDLLDETAEVLDWSLSTIDDLKADVVSHMRTWLNTSQSREMACVDAFQNSIDSNVTESLRQVTKSIDEVLGMIQVEQQHHLHRHNATAAPGPDPDPYDLALSRTADVTVSQDGSGKFKRIMDAIAAAPSHSQKQFVIFVKKGVYKEYVKIDKTKTNLALIGEGMSVTTISGDRSNASGWATMDSATFDVRAEGFLAMNIGFENTAGPSKGQAVALSSRSDRSVFYRCKISGYQDTLLVLSGRQFYRECKISGTVDFIFGYGTAVFQHCRIIARKAIKGQQDTITANGRLSEDSSGFSFQFCRIEADSDLVGNVNSTKTYLGRPWGKYSRTVFIKSFMSNSITPEGWLEWSGKTNLDTLYYAEYKNYGPGASVAGRVKWPGYHLISEVDSFAVDKLIGGKSWLPSTGVPFKADL